MKINLKNNNNNNNNNNGMYQVGDVIKRADGNLYLVVKRVKFSEYMLVDLAKNKVLNSYKTLEELSKNEYICTDVLVNVEVNEIWQYRLRRVTLMTNYYVIGTEIEGRILLQRDNGYITTYDDLSKAQAKAKKGPGWSVYSLEKVEVDNKEDKKEDEKVEKKDAKTIKIEGVIEDLFENYKNMMIHTEDNDKVGLKSDLNFYRKFINRLKEINEGKR